MIDPAIALALDAARSAALACPRKPTPLAVTARLMLAFITTGEQASPSDQDAPA